ncbi:patatin-like phospholipase family protein [Arcobacter roscoffensis]|uniref:Patatin-like phospholipase family protein n=1 Tax=Arcobacter roscoffensis TaxID=2961520 RepID=A0ABY5E646_9BACT|nr:patatin-like phospholipase family protein [Arcobacter roscoffensis]UTJ07230.1 patatin-like phospholipase family protein [Arcobacter roscoffensis]
MQKKKTVSLVLGSGGARGYAHIGVIKELEKQGYEIKSISGSSMGALVGGLYASGKLQAYEDWVLNFDALDILKLVDFSFSDGGMIKADKVFDKIEEFIGEDVLIEDLSIPFTATATDILNKKEVWLKKGSLKDAIRASIAIPTIFTPKKLNGRVLFDGGILNPVPILPVTSEFTDLVIAVNLNDDAIIKDKHKKIFQEDDSYFKKTIGKFLNKKFTNTKKKKLSYFEILNLSIESMQDVIARHQLASHKPDIMINVSSKACEFYDFHKAKELIEYGRCITKDVLKDY